MQLLLDTHTLLLWLFDDPKLSKRVRTLLADAGQAVFVSAASVWEITTKHRLGKLSKADDVPNRLEDYVRKAGFDELPVSIAREAAAGRLKISPRTPFDRLPIAQSMAGDLVIATADEVIQRHAETSE